MERKTHDSLVLASLVQDQVLEVTFQEFTETFGLKLEPWQMEYATQMTQRILHIGSFEPMTKTALLFLTKQVYWCVKHPGLVIELLTDNQLQAVRESRKILMKIGAYEHIPHLKFKHREYGVDMVYRG